MRVLILASSSFAAQGLPEGLRAAGHEVCTFNRGTASRPEALDLRGEYERLADIAAPLGAWDVLVNYAIVKHGTEEENLRLSDLIIAAVHKLKIRRFIQVSSISVLPAVSGAVDEETPAVAHRWKGVYSRVKVAVERHFEEHLTAVPLVVVRPGFILGDGLDDPIVGIGRTLPSGHVLGLGSRHSVIPLISRDDVNAALTKLVDLPLAGHGGRFMLVSPDAPTREEYLCFHCQELGRGRAAFHVPAWMWRVGLASGSVALTLLKRRPFRLVKLFEHNLNVRQYDCRRTSQQLGLDFRFDWRQTLRRTAELGPSPKWPGSDGVAASGSTKVASQLHYVGFGRIVQQKHLPGLARCGFKGRVSWEDPGLSAAPLVPSLRIESKAGRLEGATHAVVTAPWPARPGIFKNLPATIKRVLVEKPFAVSREQVSRLSALLVGRETFLVHNYRLKPNVEAFRRFLEARPSGALRWVTLHYDTPSPHIERSAWVRNEWANRIVLTDFAVHYLDLAWMLFQGPMEIQRCQATRNSRGELGALSAEMSFSRGACSVFIRQGAHKRQCSLTYVFDNYTVQLGFFPDTFQAVFGGRSLVDDLRLFDCGVRATAQKVIEKLGLHVYDRSHDQILASFLGIGDAKLLNQLALPALLPFYERLTELADRVYGVD